MKRRQPLPGTGKCSLRNPLRIAFPVLLLSAYACNLEVTSSVQKTVEPVVAVATTQSARPPVASTDAQPAATATASPLIESPVPTPTATVFGPYKIQAETLYEGTKEYVCDEGGCWRSDGQLLYTPDYYFPDIEVNNPDIDAMLANIGLPFGLAVDDGEIWKKTRVVWSWLKQNSLDMIDPGGQAPYDYIKSLSYDFKPPHFPSLSDYAKVYKRYHVVS